MKQMTNKKRRLSVSLSTITVISIAVAAIAAVSVCIAVFSTVYQNSLIHDARINSEQTIGQAEVSVNNYFESMKKKLTLIKGIIKETGNTAELESKMSALTFIQDDIYAVTVYGENGEIVSCTGSGEKLKEHIYKYLSFNRELFNESPGFSISNPHVQTLFEGKYPWVITVAARSDKPVLNNGAYIAIDFGFSEIAKYIEQVGVGRRGYCFITDRNGEIIYHPHQQMLFSGLRSEDSELVGRLPDGINILKNVIYTVKTTDDGAWRIVGVSLTDDLSGEAGKQIVISILISFVCCVLITLLSLAVYSKIVNTPVKSLIKAMKCFENDADNFSFSGGEESVTELKTLSGSFEHMSVRIKNLMDKVRNEEIALRKTELKALQSQINPHFLYNTLDSIQWMCERGKTEEASKMVGALARLFRISISRGHELITIKDEINHVSNYLIIQSFRYKSQFTYSFDIDESLEDYLCNKITLQPLVENAIYHGIDRLVDEGEIKITVKQAEDDENDILMTVADNGVGMTEEQCRKILSKERSDSSGIGVKNVNDRLRIYFGEKYGLTIKSELDCGTEITVRLPKITKED